MSQKLVPLSQRKERLCIGIMSGTSCDGIDCALVRISGSGVGLKASELGFVTVPYQDAVRERLLALAKGDVGGSHELTLMAFLLGDLFTEACLKLCDATGVKPRDIDVIGSHGHTVFHLPQSEPYLGRAIRGTMQIGDVSRLAETFSCPVVSDFRVRDFAVGGMGAPLVPYTEYLLYRSDTETVALQNIGGIGNVTILPKGCTPEKVVAFDTGPGNMVIDALASHYTQGTMRYDDGGRMASHGTLLPRLERFFLSDPYLSQPIPKTTGRERYGQEFVRNLLSVAGDATAEDVLYSATWFTAEAIRRAVAGYQVDRLVIAGGGSHNRTLLSILGNMLPSVAVMRGEDAGYNSDSKEAVAFAILANECVCGQVNSLPSATGGAHPVVLGKIQL
ncbi:MAG: anhydro-N-acetylmuramic acid kinase [Sphaerochaeta sp.]|jgi:anhydro-N-acetylmuramic acid kinase|nr:anhydro-N-acetylmuramic acid kinase [Sphaerochaeta sp.]